MIQAFVNTYLKGYMWLAKPRIEKSDLNPRSIHAHLLTVYTTGILMWAYAFVAFYTIDHPLPGIIGFMCSAVHLLTVFMFRFTKNIFLICSLMLLPGIIHQGVFSYFTGGFMSPILVWYGIIPSLAGLIAGKRATFIWAIIVMSIVSFFFLGELSGHDFPDLISPTGELISQFLLTFGWIAVITLVLYAFMEQLGNFEISLKTKNEKVDGLLKVLLHDFSNSIQIINNSLIRVENKEDERIIMAKNHTRNMIELIRSIKEVYLAELKERNLSMIPVSLDSSLLKVKNVLESNCQSKNVTINICPESCGVNVMTSRAIFENQVLTNLLTNAIKFSHQNAKIDIWCEKKEEYINLHIRDYGIGIPKEILQKLFLPNAETSRKGTQNESGSGLGMLIIKSFIEQMDGKIEVESKEYEGTEVIVSLVPA